MTAKGRQSKVDTQARVRRTFLVQAFLGFATVAGATILLVDETRAVFAGLGMDGPVLVIGFFLFISLLGLLKFELTDLVFVSMVLVGDIAMIPVLGTVISAWIAVLAAMATRVLSGLGADDPRTGLDPIGTFRLFGTYGIPVVVASLLYGAMGGEAPVSAASAAEVIRIAVSGLVLILTNNILMEFVMAAYGYEHEKRLRLSLLDASLYVMALPFSVCLALSIHSLGLGAAAALAFSGVLMNAIAKRLANARAQTRDQLQRLVSLSTIGKTISLNFTTDELLETIYRECRKVVDVTMFSIALVDEATGELCFELDVVHDEKRPKERIPLGDGLNSWVIRHHRPLLLSSQKEERTLGLVSLEDGLTTESWLGVPMIARDRVIGVISVQSFKKNAFSPEDEILLISIANQAAVALENATLYRDLESLTYALEHRVQERTAELRETNLRLLAADRSKNQFLANMSHELRTPLNSIIGFAQVLLDQAKDTLPARKYGFLENIRKAGAHLLDLISDILDLSKIEAGKMHLQIEEFDLRHTLDSIERVMHGYAASVGVAIGIDVASDVPRLRLDEGRLKQILFNLLSNAIKFSHANGRVDVRARLLDERTSPLGARSVQIEVRDRGIGMEERELQKIFDEFYQTEQGRRARSGTGLGLSLARNFVELHHGKIEVASKQNEGSTFTITLPTTLPLPAPDDLVESRVLAT
jgi:signal transduction histidine kinase